MKIKRLEICGFKSFVDRTTIHFPDPVTAIVGPNGCGKSNIVDAIRWCMGEQSAKHLRGRSMDDVIFAGSETRGPAGMAEVSLTFDARGLPAATAPGGVPWGEANPEEIVITRRLYRDGTSEYLLGGVPCRLRDIVDFFLGTGVGTKAYSIIEQGRVGFIVSSKPEDRRTLIDEAAGITKYKAKKKQAERRMESTRQHLLRVSDIIGEIDSRLRSLRLQAQKAERYKRYKTELRELELWDASHRYLGHLAEEKISKADHQVVRQDHEEKTRVLATDETEVEAERITLAHEQAELATLREGILEISNSAQLSNQRAHHYEDEATRLGEQAREADREVGDIRERLSANELLTRELESSLSKLAAEAEGAEGRYREEDAIYQNLRTELADVRKKAEAAGKLAAEARTRIARDESELNAAHARQDDLRTRMDALSGEEVHLRESLATVVSEIQSLETSLGAIASRNQALEEGLSENRRLVDSYKEQVSRGGVEIETLREEVHRRRSRLQSLNEIQARYESFERGVGAIMRQCRKPDALSIDVSAADDAVGPLNHFSLGGSVRGLVADIVQPPPELETAVEAVLGARLGSVVVESHDVGVEAIEYLKRQSEGRSSFIPLTLRSPSGGSPIQTSGGEVVYDAAGESSVMVEGDVATVVSAAWPEITGDGVRGALIDLVGFDRQYDKVAAYLLGDVVVVESLPKALAIWREKQPGKTLVTLDGDVIDPHGIVTGGSPDEARSGVLSQKREIRELESLVASIESDLQTATERQVSLKQVLTEATARLSDNETQLREGAMARLGAEKDLASGKRRSVEQEARLVQLESNAAGLRSSQASIQGRIAEIEAEMSAVALRLAESDAELARENAEAGRLSERLDAIVGSLTELKVASAQAGERRANAELSLDRTRRLIAEQLERIARLEQGGREHLERAETLRRDAARLSEEAAGALAQAEERSKEHAERADLAENRSGMLAAREEGVRSLRVRVNELAAAMSALQLRCQQAELKRISIEEHIAERYRDAVLSHVVSDYHLRPPVSSGEHDRADQLRGIIERMGEINLTAIEESEEYQKRFDFLTAQKTDLETAMEQLETAISKINRASRRRFQEVFEAVDAKFQEVFPRLFRGGRARLVLTNPEDMLETGVDIVANPPGKKINQNLELLSGGEKALTAVSLLFAIFLVKPSPFCVLDEVDAPLDDVNVTRFAQGLTEMVDRSQFIVITHSKQSMEIADRLCGVTMEEPGVSKLVAVQMRGRDRGRGTIATEAPPQIAATGAENHA